MPLAMKGGSFLINALKKDIGWLDYVSETLTSERVREAIGERSFDPNGEGDSPGFLEKLNPGGIFGFLNPVVKFIGGINKFGNFMVRKVFGALTWSISEAFGWVAEQYFELINFDFVQADKEIADSINAAWRGVAYSTGAFFGTSAVWAVASVAVGAATVKWPAISANIALEVAQEGSQEILSRFRNLMTNAFTATVQSVAKLLFLAGRWAVLGGKSIHPSDNKKPWTIAEAIDTFVEKLPPFIEEGTRGLFDSIEDSIFDFGYVLAFSLDDHYESQKMSRNPPPETERAIKLYRGDGLNEQGVLYNPPPDAPYVYIEGDQDYVVQQADDVMLQASATEIVLAGRDIGEFLGVPYEEWQRATPKRSNLQIRYHDNDKPPFRRQGGRTAQFNIPDPKPLTWEKIKQASISYTYGPVLTTIKLDNGRSMQCWASTETEGLTTLKRLLDLSSAKMVGFPAHTKIDDSLLPPAEKKRNVKMTAAFGTYTIARSTRGITDPSYLHSKNKKWAKNTFKIWVATEAESGFERPLGD